MKHCLTLTDDSPYLRQGSLDGLCGVYSVVNALTLIHGSDFDQKALFRDLLLSMRHRVVSLTMTGMHLHEYQTVIRRAKKYFDNINKPFGFRLAYCIAPDSLDDFWKTLCCHYKEHGQGSILVGMTGQYDHWTCIQDITDTKIVLADSGYLSELYRTGITIKKPTKLRPIGLQPCQTILLQKA